MHYERGSQLSNQHRASASDRRLNHWTNYRCSKLDFDFADCGLKSRARKVDGYWLKHVRCRRYRLNDGQLDRSDGDWFRCTYPAYCNPSVHLHAGLHASDSHPPD